MTMRWLPAILGVLMLFGGSLQAQDGQPEKLLAVGVVIQSYKGDLSDTYSTYSGSFKASLLFNKKERWNGGINLMIGNLSGQTLSGIPSAGSPQPNTFFKTSVVSLHYDLRYNLVSKEKWKAYVSLGFGLMRFNPKDQDDNNLQDLIDTRAANETYGNITGMMPLQVGVMYFLPNGFGVNFQTGFLNTFTDYLDNVSDLGNQSGGDNILQFQFSLLAPLKSN